MSNSSRSREERFDATKELVEGGTDADQFVQLDLDVRAGRDSWEFLIRTTS